MCVFWFVSFAWLSTVVIEFRDCLFYYVCVGLIDCLCASVFVCCACLFVRACLFV